MCVCVCVCVCVCLWVDGLLCSQNHMWVIGRIGQHCQRLDENNVADTTVTDEEVTAAYGQGHRTRITVSESYHLLHNNVTNLITEDSGLGSSREVSPSHTSNQV